MNTVHFFQFTEELVEKIKERIKERIGEEARVDIHDTRKNNGVTYSALTIMMPGSNVSPNIPLECFYEDYQQGMSMDEIVSQILDLYDEKSISNMDVEFFTDFSKAKENIMFRLVNYEENREDLKRMPHERYLDLAITYFYHLDMDLHKGENASIQINNDHINMWGVSKEELSEIAKKNTLQKMPVRSRQIADLLMEMMCERLGTDFHEMGEEFGMDLSSVPLYVFTNIEGYYGASVLCYPDLLKETSQKWDADLIVLPSSIHELLIMPVSGNEDLEEYNKMIQEINESQVLSYEVLSDHLYYYDRIMDQLLLK